MWLLTGVAGWRFQYIFILDPWKWKPLIDFHIFIIFQGLKMAETAEKRNQAGTRDRA